MLWNAFIYYKQVGKYRQPDKQSRVPYAFKNENWFAYRQFTTTVLTEISGYDKPSATITGPTLQNWIKNNKVDICSFQSPLYFISTKNLQSRKSFGHLQRSSASALLHRVQINVINPEMCPNVRIARGLYSELYALILNFWCRLGTAKIVFIIRKLC